MFLLQDNPIGDMLNNTEWAFPAAEVVHILGFGIAVGTIMMVDLRVMGLELAAEHVNEGGPAVKRVAAGMGADERLAGFEPAQKRRRIGQRQIPGSVGENDGVVLLE